MYFGNILKDIKSFTTNSRIKKDNNILIYNSELIEKIELSLEMIMEIIYTNLGKVELFDKKKFLIIILEVARLFYRLKELMSLDKQGFNFYVQKHIYHEHIAELTEDEIKAKLTEVDP
jgi:hypothetical protein